MTKKELQSAALLQDSGQQVTGVAGDFLQAVSTSCRAVGHSPESAAFNRRNYFALEDYFGCSGLFFTTSPCDQDTFRVRLFVGSGRPHELPPLMDLEKAQENLGDYLLDFNFRRRQRLRYPGACSLAYQHLIQIVIEVLLGWDPKT